MEIPIRHGPIKKSACLQVNNLYMRLEKMKNNKGETVYTKLCSYMNRLGEGKEIRKKSLQAHIPVIPKEGKLCDSVLQL